MRELVRPTTVACLLADQVEYRLDRRGETVVVLCHGRHVRAGLALGDEVFAAAGHTVLVPSRPGYGRTPLSTGISAEGFADAIRELCAHLGIARVAAAAGISGGGPTAATLALRGTPISSNGSSSSVPWDGCPTLDAGPASECTSQSTSGPSA
jgi:pimeloyl-ACP methyl ester carboxylesterase